MPPDGNGWSKWEHAVLRELDDLKADVKQLRVDVAALKIKSGLWGAAAGAIPAVTALLWVLLK